MAVPAPPSGMTAPHRLRDLVIELIRINGLDEAFDRYVQEKYPELWRAAQGTDAE